jgi:hypothetical protein
MRIVQEGLDRSDLLRAAYPKLGELMDDALWQARLARALDAA